MKVAIRNKEDPGRKQRRKQGQTHRIMKGARGTQQKNEGEPSKNKGETNRRMQGAIRKEWEPIKKTRRNQ